MIGNGIMTSNRDGRSVRMFDRWKKLADRIRDLTPSIERSQLIKYDDITRRSFYRILLEQKALSKDEIRKLLSWERNSQCQILIISMYLNLYEISEEELDGLLTHRSLIVRRKALEKKYDLTGKPWDGLEDMLLSPSASIRGDVRYILGKQFQRDKIHTSRSGHSSCA